MSPSQYSHATELFEGLSLLMIIIALLLMRVEYWKCHVIQLNRYYPVGLILLLFINHLWYQFGTSDFIIKCALKRNYLLRLLLQQGNRIEIHWKWPNVISILHGHSQNDLYKLQEGQRVLSRSDITWLSPVREGGWIHQGQKDFCFWSPCRSLKWCLRKPKELEISNLVNITRV